MTGRTNAGLVVAIDYYDGEAEGFAQAGAQCCYFNRLDEDSDTGLATYAVLPVDLALFEEVVRLSGAVRPPCGVFVYAGSSSALNTMLDEILPNLRQQIRTVGNAYQGPNLLEALQSPYSGTTR